MTDTSFSNELLGAQGPPQQAPREPLGRPTEPPSFVNELFGEQGLRPPGMAGEMTGPSPTAEFDFPEITDLSVDFRNVPGMTGSQLARLAGGLLFAVDPAQQADIVRENVPGAELDTDRFGNLFARIPGIETPVYINRPGPSFQDVTQMGAFAAPAIRVGQAGAALGQSALGNVLGQGAGRVIGTGIGEAALSRIADFSLQGVGSQQPPSSERALGAAAFGAAGEAILPPLAGLLAGAGRRGVQVFRPDSGRPALTEEARALITDAGIDPNAITPELTRRLNEELSRAAVPAEAQRVAEATTLPTPVPLTRGNITRQPNDQMFEDMAAKGAFGRTTQAVVQGTRDQQQAALRANVEQIQGQLSGGQSQVVTRGDTGTIVSEAVNEIRDNANRVVEAAYAQARNTGQAGIPGNAIPSLTFNLGRAAADRLPNAPQASALLEELSTLGQQVGPDGAVLVGPLFDWRRRVTTLASDTARTNPTEAGALRAMRGAFDAQMTDLVEQGLLLGDDAAVDAWLTAIARRREFGQIFQAANRASPNYLVDLLTETLPGGETRVLKFAPDQAANAIFGATNTGWINNPQLARQLGQLESVLRRGGRADAWDALREEAFTRLFAQSEGPFIGSTNVRSFSGAGLARSIDQAMERNRPAMMALFSPEELALMAQLQRTALATTTVTSGGANFSNTAVAQSQMFQSAFGRLFGRIFGPALQSAAESVPLGNVPQLIRATRATDAARPQGRPGLPPGVGGAIGATAGPEAQEELQRRF